MLKKKLGNLSKVNKRKMFSGFVTAVVASSMLSIVAFADDAGAQAFMTGLLDILQIVLVAIGGGLGVWGIVNLLEGYGNDNAGAKSQGMKQLMAGIGVALVGVLGMPLLDTFVTGWF